MRFRVRGPNGQAAVTLPDDASIEDLRTKIAEVTAVPSFDVKYGYPPQPLDLEAAAPSALVSQLGISLNGETLIISSKASEAARKAQPPPTERRPPADTNAPHPKRTFAAKSAGAAPPSSPLALKRKPPPNDPPELPMPAHAATLVLRIMPDDNSCLFRAFNSAYFGAMDNMQELRSVIAQTIQADPETYSAVVLERAPDDYCRWIQSPDAWGGQIELQILSQHFEVEVCSVDVQTGRVDRYNEGQLKRCVLVYSGIHYDVVALSPSDAPHDHANLPPEFDLKVFDAQDDDVLQKSVAMCRLLNRQGYFTDTAGFSVKCNVCQKVVVGESGATDHAKETGHYDFGET